jgi:hypothetical protein
MDDAPATWPYLLGGLCSSIAGWWLRATSSLDGLCRLLGSGPASRQERTWIPWLLLLAGAAWLFMWLGTFLTIHGQRPYLVVILSVLLTPLAALAFTGVLLWLVILRRAAG